jgi:hypothetical protein
MKPGAAVAAVEIELVREDVREVGTQLRGILTPAQNALRVNISFRVFNSGYNTASQILLLQLTPA